MSTKDTLVGLLVFAELLTVGIPVVSLGGQPAAFAQELESDTPVASPEPDEPTNYISQFLAAARDGDLDTLKNILRMGIGANDQDDNGMTALMYAAQSGRSDIVSYLLMHGADNALINRDGKTASDLASGSAVVAVFRAYDKKIQAVDKEYRAKVARQAKEEEQHKQELVRKFGPLQITGMDVRENSIGIPEVTLTVINNSKKVIDAFEVEFVCRDNFGRTLRSFGYGASSYVGISQNRIAPGGFEDDTWTFNGFSTATKFTPRIVRIHFSNGTTWKR